VILAGNTERRQLWGIVDRDMYHLRQWPADAFSLILDVGANMGAFSLACRILFPRARIVAFEPHPETHRLAAQNLRNLRVDLRQMALWHPPRAWLRKGRNSTGNSFGPEKSTISAPAGRLDKLFRLADAKGEDQILLKIDAEGAEACLIGHRATRGCLRQCKAIEIELHKGKLLPRLSPAIGYLACTLSGFEIQVKRSRRFAAFSGRKSAST